MVNLRDNAALISSISVLVVDDDAMVRNIICEYLRAFGFTDIVEANGRRAQQIINDTTAPIDLILSDWEMPEVDGLTLLRLTRKVPHRQSAKFIMITSQVPEERIKIIQARTAGVDAYIVKPFKGRLLREKIWSVLGWGSDSGEDDEQKAG